MEIEASQKKRIVVASGALTISPTSPENSKLVSYASTTAPSPRTLPRAVSRTSDETERRTADAIGRFPPGLDLNEDRNSEQHVEGAKAKTISRPISWQWEYASDKVGAYDIQSRRVRVERYREKRRQLSFHKVRYSARSNICQKRERIGGRFVKTDRIIRADKEALMHPNALPRSSKQPRSPTDQNELKSLAEMMVELSRRVPNATTL